MKSKLVCISLIFVLLFLSSVFAADGTGKRVEKHKVSGVKVVKIQLASVRAMAVSGGGGVLPVEIQQYVESYTFNNKASRRSKATKKAIIYMTVKDENIDKLKQVLAASGIQVIGKDEDAYEEIRK